MISYRGYLRPHLGFILDELAKGLTPFATARALYARGVRTSGSPSPKAQVAALNILIRHMLGKDATRKGVLSRRITTKKAQIAKLQTKLADLHAQKRALGGAR